MSNSSSSCPEASPEDTLLVSLYVGLALGVCISTAITVNCAVLYAIISGMIRSRRMRNNSIYVIALSNLIADIVQLTLNLVVLVPSIVIQKWFFSSPETLWQASTIFMFLWYHSSLSQILMSINRYLAVVGPSSPVPFQWHRSLCLALAINPVSIVGAALSQHFFPCCQFEFNYSVFSYSYNVGDGGFNVSNHLIDLPLNTASSLVAAVSYTLIVHHMRQTRSKLSVCLAPATFLRKKYREYRYAMQFCFISFFYTLAWIFFRILPYVVPCPGPFYATVPLAVTLHCSSNAIIYLLRNPEIQRELSVTFRFRCKPDSFSPRTTSNVKRSGGESR